MSTEIELRWSDRALYDPAYRPTDPAERLVWAKLPADGARGAISYEVAIDTPGLTLDQARHALLRLVGACRARCWQEAPGIYLVARGPFRACDRCGAKSCPGPCRACGFDPAASEAS